MLLNLLAGELVRHPTRSFAGIEVLGILPPRHVVTNLQLVTRQFVEAARPVFQNTGTPDRHSHGVRSRLGQSVSSSSRLEGRELIALEAHKQSKMVLNSNYTHPGAKSNFFQLTCVVAGYQQFST